MHFNRLGGFKPAYLRRVIQFSRKASNDPPSPGGRGLGGGGQRLENKGLSHPHPNPPPSRGRGHDRELNSPDHQGVAGHGTVAMKRETKGLLPEHGPKKVQKRSGFGQDL